MSKSIILGFLCCCLLLACSAPSEQQNPTTENTETTPSEAQKPAAATSKIAGIGACTLLSESTLQQILVSPKGYNFNERNDDRGKSIQCGVGLKEGFGSLTWAITHNKNGHSGSGERYAKNNMFKTIDINGADGAFINETMKVIKAWKGNYLVTLNLPVTMDKMNNLDWMKANGVKVTEELLEHF